MLVVQRSMVFPGYITTVAGGSRLRRRFSCDIGAPLSGVAVDASGNIFIADGSTIGFASGLATSIITTVAGIERTGFWRWCVANCGSVRPKGRFDGNLRTILPIVAFAKSISQRNHDDSGGRRCLSILRRWRESHEAPRSGRLPSIPAGNLFIADSNDAFEGRHTGLITPSPETVGRLFRRRRTPAQPEITRRGGLRRRRQSLYSGPVQRRIGRDAAGVITTTAGNGIQDSSERCGPRPPPV